MTDFGTYLRNLRGNRSLREMEQITGLSHTYLRTLEKGFDPRSKKERRPTPDALKKLASALSIDYFDLMEKAGYVNKNDYFFEETTEGVKSYSGIEALKRRQQLHLPYPKMDSNESLFTKESPNDDDLYSFLQKENITYLGYSLSKQDRQTIIETLKVLFPDFRNDSDQNGEK